MKRRSPLLTWTHGDSDDPIIMILHDRYENPDGRRLHGIQGSSRIITVRSARMQMAGTETLGYFWFLGPYERPELTTFGDGLYHLETLLIDLVAQSAKSKVLLMGKGEGGVMALTLATIWPELIAGVVSIDGPLPENINAFPIYVQSLSNIRIALIERHRSLENSETNLSALGAIVQRMRVEEHSLNQAVNWLNDQLSFLHMPVSSAQ